MLILAPDHLLRPGGGVSTGDAILVDGGAIVALGPATDLCAAFPQAAVETLPGCVLMPGLVNAHQHGRGVSQIVMGYADDALEPWIAGRALHGAPDIYAVTRLAAEAMIANGVTACLHANYAYGTGDYEGELDASIRAYRDSGLRTTICVGYQDRGFGQYPASPADTGGRAPAVPPYAGDVAQTLSLLERLRDRYHDQPALTVALGPAGPQWVSDAAWQALSRHAAQAGIGIHFHLLESPAQAKACQALYGGSTLAILQRFGVFEARTSCAHGVFMTAADMAIAKACKLGIVINPGANLRLFNGAPPIADMLDAGCRLAVGTDNTALSDDEDYLRELRLAQLLGRRPGIDARGPDAGQMLALATANGAEAAFLPASTGQIEVGAPADLVAMDLAEIAPGAPLGPAELANHIICRGRGAHVRLTMVAGRILNRAGAADRDRLQHWRSRATRSVQHRPLRDARSVRDAQHHLREHYRSMAGTAER